MTPMINATRATKMGCAAVSISLLTLLGCPVLAQTPSPEKTVVNRADQLPRRSYQLTQLPSTLLEASAADTLALAEIVDKDILADLARFDIRDSATLRAYIGGRMSIALLRNDRVLVTQLARQMRGLEEKPGPKFTSGVLAEIATQIRGEGGSQDVQSAKMKLLVTERYSAMPWADVQDSIKGLKGRMEIVTPALVLGSIRASMDPAAKNGGLKIDLDSALALIGARTQSDQILPFSKSIAAALSDVVGRNTQVSQAKPDIWTPRLVTLQPTDNATPVAIAVWDSGVDLPFFKANPARGIAFTADAMPSSELLRPLGEAQQRWPQLKAMIKGALDLRASLDTDAARDLKVQASKLSADQVKAFQEDMSLAGVYVHGTHVAGIAVDGNPFANVFAVTMLWDHRVEPAKPSEELSKRVAASYISIAKSLKDAGVRVVNMSWRYGPSSHESAMSYHGIGGTPEERKTKAAALFKIERDALNAAIASAPEILFVTGSGNEDNSADFEEYIPAGLVLPNLITVGAVDKSGNETSFSTFGKTVLVHANGFEVLSLIPGGERMSLSGTSMAAPQVTNLAAKMLALNPSLTAAKVKQAIIVASDKNGRVNLIHPQKTLAAMDKTSN